MGFLGIDFFLVVCYKVDFVSRSTIPKPLKQDIWRYEKVRITGLKAKLICICSQASVFKFKNKADQVIKLFLEKF